jgi:hypothetical protein
MSIKSARGLDEEGRRVLPGDMAIDIVPDIIAALRSAGGREALADAVRAVVHEEIRLALAEQRDTLKPLSAILGISAAAARMRITRDPRLRAVGFPIGRRLLFRAHEVEAYLRGCGRNHYLTQSAGPGGATTI